MVLRIETFGLPGSGKSTLTKACAPLLKDAGIKVLTPKTLDQLDQKVKGPAPVLWRKDSFRQSYHIAEFDYGWPAVNRFFATRYGDRFRSQALILATGADVIKAQRLADHYDMLWVDEGFLHYGMHAIVLAQGALTDAHDLVQCMPKPDAVVMVDQNPAAARDSVLARSVAGGMSEERATAYVAKYFGDLAAFQFRYDLIQTTCDALGTACVPIIRQTAMGPIDDMAQETVKSLKKLHNST